MMPIDQAPHVGKHCCLGRTSSARLAIGLSYSLLLVREFPVATPPALPVVKE
jgi:hypothetical protein